MTTDFASLRVAITGGIGSGKSVMCQRFARRGIDVYDCDDAAKRLMRTDRHLQDELSLLVGRDVFKDGILQKSVLAGFLLESEEHKQKVNDVIHPAVARDFEQSGYRWLESAILFDSGFYKRTHLDCVICVSAPLDLRIKRVMERDHITREKAVEWMNRQMPQEEVIRRSDYELVSGREDIEEQIDCLLDRMKKDYNGK